MTKEEEMQSKLLANTRACTHTYTRVSPLATPLRRDDDGSERSPSPIIERKRTGFDLGPGFVPMPKPDPEQQAAVLAAAQSGQLGGGISGGTGLAGRGNNSGGGGGGGGGAGTAQNTRHARRVYVGGLPGMACASLKKAKAAA